MNPLSATATITSLCFTSGKLLVGFFEYIHDIKDTPSYIEALTAELSALNTALMGLRTLIIVREGSQRDVLLKLTENSTIALDNCKETLHQIEEMVKKSKIKTKQSSHGQVITCIKWLWNKKEVILLKDRLEAYKSTISLMLQISSGQSQDETAALLDKIHQSVSKLQEDRAHVKETLVIMENNHPRFEEAEFSVVIRPTRPFSDPSSTSSSHNFRPFNEELWGRMKTDSWTAARIRCASRWADMPALLGCEVKVAVQPNRQMVLKVTLSQNTMDALTKQHEILIAAHKKEIEVQMTKNNTIADGIGKKFMKGFTEGAISSTPNSPLARFVTLGVGSIAAATLSSTVKVAMDKSTMLETELPYFLKQYKTGKLSWNVAFSTFTRKSDYSIVISLSEQPNFTEEDGGLLELSFDVVADAEEFSNLFTAIKLEVEASWMLHTLSFANIDRDLAVENEEQLRAKAISQCFQK